MSMFMIKKKETIKAIKETFTVIVSKKEFDEIMYEQRNEVEKFMEETLDESELDIVDIIHKNNKVEIIAEKISEL